MAYETGKSAVAVAGFTRSSASLCAGVLKALEIDNSAKQVFIRCCPECKYSGAEAGVTDFFKTGDYEKVGCVIAISIPSLPVGCLRVPCAWRAMSAPWGPGTPPL